MNIRGTPNIHLWLSLYDSKAFVSAVAAAKQKLVIILDQCRHITLKAEDNWHWYQLTAHLLYRSCDWIYCGSWKWVKKVGLLPDSYIEREDCLHKTIFSSCSRKSLPSFYCGYQSYNLLICIYYTFWTIKGCLVAQRKKHLRYLSRFWKMLLWQWENFQLKQSTAEKLLKELPQSNNLHRKKVREITIWSSFACRWNIAHANCQNKRIFHSSQCVFLFEFDACV